MTLTEKLKGVREALHNTLQMFKGENSQPEIKVSEMVIGGKVEIVNADGSLADAPDGEYTIDKDVIEVKAGQIVSINGETETKPKEEEQAAEDTAPKEDMPADNGTAEMQAQLDALKAETESLKATVEEIKKAMGDNQAAEQKMSEDFSKQITDLTDALKVISNMPAEFSQTNNSPVIKDAQERKLAEMALVGSVLNKNKK